MSEGRPLRYRELVNRVKPFGVEEIRQGSGSRRMLRKTNIEGRDRSYPIHPHSEHDEIPTHIIRIILRRFKIPPESFWK